MFSLHRSLLVGWLVQLVPSANAQHADAPRDSAPATLQVVTTFEHQVTGVTMTPDGRTFVSFPRWSEDAPISVAELAPGGTLRPYPDAEWNAWRNTRRDELSPKDHWVGVQGAVPLLTR